MRQAFKGCALALAAMAIAQPAEAQDAGRWRTRVTIGAQVEPQYPGADKEALGPLIDVDRARGDTPFEFEAADDSFGFSLIKSGGFELGPVANLVGPRKPQDVGVAVPKVSRTIELGMFAQGWLTDNVRLHGEVRRGVNGHDGWVAVGGGDLVARNGDKWLVSIGPRVTWADNKFHDAYFSITPSTAGVTGLPIYDAGSGIEAVGLSASADMALTRRWGLAMFGKYDRLVGDAADSPLVRGYGSRDQFSAGVGISYTF